MKIVIDTSALISLEAGGILELVTENFNLIITGRVEEELRGISQNHDFEGNIAKIIIGNLGNGIEVIKAYKSSIEGEIECAHLANELSEAEFLVTDDTAALEKLEKICKKKVRFSTLLLYALLLKEKITKKQALNILKRMRVKRDWKDNIIFEQARLMLENMDV